MCVEPQPSLMLRPSGSTATAVTSAPSRRKISGADAVGGAVRAVEQDALAGQVEALEAQLELAQVVARGAVQLAHAARARAAGAARPDDCLDARLLLVGELRPVRPEELDPVVGDTGCGTPTRPPPGRGRSGGRGATTPGVGSTPPSRAWPPAAATPAASAASSISPDSRVSRTISTCGACARETVAAARPSAERQLGGQELARDAADAVGPEQAPLGRGTLH